MADEKKYGLATFIAGIGKLRKAASAKAEQARQKIDEAATPMPPPAPGEAPKEKVKIDISPDSHARQNKKKLLTVAAATIGVLVMIAAVIKHQPPPKAEEKKPDNITMMPSDAIRQSFEAQTQTDINNLQKQAAEAARTQQMTQADIKDIRVHQDSVEKALTEITTTLKRLDDKANAPAPTAVPPPPEQGLNGKALPQNAPAIPPPPLPPGAKGTATGPVVNSPANDGPIVITPDADSGGADTSGAPSKDKVGARSEYKKNPYAGYLPPGFAPTVLLTGVEAGTSEGAQSDPQPILMRMERPAILPGAASYEIEGCFALGSAHGSLSTERAYIRLASLSCVDKNKHLVLESQIKGYVVDSDGLFGLRGTLVQRQGAVLARALLAGFASGLGSALGSAQGTSTTSVLGTTSTLTGSSALRSAAFGGGSNAANQLANFYLKQAESIFPVIEVEPKRKATVVVTEGASLKWNDYGSLYIKDTTPEGTNGSAAR